MKLPQDTHEKMMSAYQLIAAGSISVGTFEQVRILLKGFHPGIDKKLAICSKALDQLQKIQTGDVISLSAEALPEKDEKQKKRKRALVLFISSMKDLQSEIKRIDTEFESNQSSTAHLMSWGRIIKFSKGPFGLITFMALLIVGITLFFNHKANSNKKTEQVILFHNKQIPITQLYIGHGPDCDSPHYHAKAGSVITIDGTTIVDPEGCGFGRVSATQTITITLQ